MANLDNSGPILIDAVLTTTGRRRMAEGNFKISKFALGDDEIDYSLYVAGTGSAYQDLEILQTPIWESTTSDDTTIQYGLLSFNRNDLLYMPDMVVNEKIQGAAVSSNNVYYVAANAETYNKLIASDALGDPKYVMEPNQDNGTKLILETGLNGAASDGVNGTESNRLGYLQSEGLVDKRLGVRADNRLFKGVMGPKGDRNTRFNNKADGMADINLPISQVAFAGKSKGTSNYNTAYIKGVNNTVTYNPNQSATNISAIDKGGGGPRASATAVNFAIDETMKSTSTGTRSSKYTLHGSTNKQGTDFGWSSTEYFDIADSTVYVEGEESSAEKQVNVRIIRYVGDAAKD